MKTFTLPFAFAILSLCASPNALAATLEQLVATDAQALVDDTVNEGEQTAHVVYERELPKVACKVSAARKAPARKWALCRVSFEVRYEDLETERECKLLYSFAPKRIARTLSREPNEMVATCLENLSESIE